MSPGISQADAQVRAPLPAAGGTVGGTMYLILFGVSGVGVLVLVTHALLGADPDRSVRKVEWITLATAVAVAAACGVAMFLTAP